MTKKNLLLNSLIFISLIFLSSCAQLQSPSELTQMQKLTMMLSTYNSQYTSYMVTTGYSQDEKGSWTKVSNPTFTEDERAILSMKRKMLTKLYSLIDIYASMVSGTTPYSSDTEAQILNLIDSLSTFKL